MTKCPCCSKIDYKLCCCLYHTEHQIPKTPEALMRSRYSAYVLANIDYIKKTMQGKPLQKFNDQETKTWTQNVKWLKLKIINTWDISCKHGYVEFIANFIENGEHRSLHEISEFQLIDDRWFYVDGTHI